MKILIIEDEEPIQRLYKMKLTSAGYDVLVANNGVEGLKKAEQFQPDLILLDLRMPEMNGDEMLAKMRDTDWGKDIKVIILTNISKDEAPRTIWHYGVKHYITKVLFTPQQVVDLTRQTLASD